MANRLSVLLLSFLSALYHLFLRIRCGRVDRTPDVEQNAGPDDRVIAVLPREDDVIVIDVGPSPAEVNALGIVYDDVTADAWMTAKARFIRNPSLTRAFRTTLPRNKPHRAAKTKKRTPAPPHAPAPCDWSTVNFQIIDISRKHLSSSAAERERIRDAELDEACRARSVVVDDEGEGQKRGSGSWDAYSGIQDVSSTAETSFVLDIHTPSSPDCNTCTNQEKSDSTSKTKTSSASPLTMSSINNTGDKRHGADSENENVSNAEMTLKRTCANPLPIRESALPYPDMFDLAMYDRSYSYSYSYSYRASYNFRTSSLLGLCGAGGDGEAEGNDDALGGGDNTNANTNTNTNTSSTSMEKDITELVGLSPKNATRPTHADSLTTGIQIQPTRSPTRPTRRFSTPSSSSSSPSSSSPCAPSLKVNPFASPHAQTSSDLSTSLTASMSDTFASALGALPSPALRALRRAGRGARGGVYLEGGCVRG